MLEGLCQSLAPFWIVEYATWRVMPRDTVDKQNYCCRYLLKLEALDDESLRDLNHEKRMVVQQARLQPLGAVILAIPLTVLRPSIEVMAAAVRALVVVIFVK